MKDMKVNENRPQKELRSSHDGMMDSAMSIRRAGGEDPRRYDAKIVIDRAITDHSQSGYNHNATSSQPSNDGRENEMRMNRRDGEALRMGTPHPDGTYSR